jgi:GT2 family glycosyltransferase
VSATSATPAVHVVILAYDNVADTLECLDSVSRLAYPNLETTVVDNGSTDGTADVVRERFPPVHVVRTAHNRGIPGGFNLGIGAALRAGADYVFLLNNDTIVAPDLLAELVHVAESNARLGIVMPKVLFYDRRDLVWSAGGRYRRFPPAIVFIGLGQPDQRFSEIRLIEYAPSCGLLVRRAAFERVGLFDPGYLFYYDDWDFSLRVRAEGMTIAFVPNARMWHKVSRTIRKRADLFWRTWGRSCVRFYRRHGRPVFLSLPVHLGYIVAREAVKGNALSLRHFFAGARAGLSEALGPIPRVSDLEAACGR